MPSARGIGTSLVLPLLLPLHWYCWFSSEEWTLLSLPRKELYCATIQLCWKINIQQEEIQFAFVEDWLMSIEKCLSAFTLWKINYHLINQPGSSMVTSFLRCWILVCVREACSAAVSWTIHPKVVGYPNAGSSPGLIWMDTWVAVAWKMA